MLSTQLYFNGQTREAIDLYVKVFNATVRTMIHMPGRKEFIVYSEILIDNHLLMLNDFSTYGDRLKPAGYVEYDLAYKFESEEELKKAYALMKEGSRTVTPMQATEYSGCAVRFIDKFGTRWAFRV